MNVKRQVLTWEGLRPVGTAVLIPEQIKEQRTGGNSC